MAKPKIRFNGYTEDWEQRKLGEVVKEGILEAPLDGNHGEKHPTSDEYVESGIPFLMASDIHNGEVNIYSCKYITKERAERLDKGFARNGDVLLTHKATIGETAILSNLMTEYAMLTPQVTYYRIKNEERLNREYLYSFFNSLDFQTELKTKAAQSTRPYIGITAQQNLKIILPSEIDEQRKIGLYFGNLDRLITLHQRKCEQTKTLKKYMLQKMFPQDGEKVPQIRFEGFTEDWEQRKWIDTVDISTEMVDPTSGEYDNMPHIAPGNIESFTGRILDNVKAVKEEKLISGKFRFRPGDVVYGKINPQLGKYFYASVDGLTSADAYVFNGKNGLTQKFLFSLLQTNDFFKYSVSVSKRSGMPKINRDELNAYSFLTPSEAEQEKIGGLILGIDHLITLHQRKCDELKEVKKFMLQNMFV